MSGDIMSKVILSKNSDHLFTVSSAQISNSYKCMGDVIVWESWLHIILPCMGTAYSWTTNDVMMTSYKKLEK